MMSPFNQWTAVTLLDNFDLSLKISLLNSWNESVLPCSHPRRSWNNSNPVQKNTKGNALRAARWCARGSIAPVLTRLKRLHRNISSQGDQSTLPAQYHCVKNQVANHESGSDGFRKRKKKKKVDVTCLNDVNYKKNHVPWTQLEDFDKSEI